MFKYFEVLGPGPLHLPGFENRMADSPFNYRWAPAQLERQETAYVPFCYKNGKSAISITGKWRWALVI